LANIISFVRAHRVLHIPTSLGILIGDVTVAINYESLNARCQRLVVFDQLLILKLKRFLLHSLAHPYRRE
jgi:hypothetical protein